MQTSNRTSALRRFAFALMLGFIAAPSHASPPRVLQHIPPDAAAALVISSLDRFDQNTAQLLGSLEMSTVSTVSQTLSALGIGPALDMSGSAAVVILRFPEDPQEVVPAALIFPTKSSEAFVKAVRAEPDDDLFRFQYGNAPYFARFVEDHTVFISGDRALVSQFNPAQNFAGDHAELLGQTGLSILEESDAAIFAGPDTIAPVAGMFVGPLEQLLTAAQAVDPQAADAQQSAIQTLRSRLHQDSRLSIIGLKTGPLGVRLDAAAVFRGGTTLAQHSTELHEAPIENMLRENPSGEYLFASFTSFEHPAIQAILSDIASQFRARLQTEESKHAARLIAVLQKLDRASFVLYNPAKPLLVEGMLAKGLARWTAKDPADVAWRIQQYILGLAQAYKDLSPVESSYLEKHEQLQETQVDVWTLGVPRTGVAGLNAALVGASGKLIGRIAVSDRGGTLALGPTADLLRDVLSSHENAPSLADDPMVSQLASLLPPRAAAMWFLNPNPFLIQLRPFLQVALPGFQPPDAMPPIAGSLHFEHGAARISIFAPAPMLKFGISTFQRARASQPQPVGQPR